MPRPAEETRLRKLLMQSIMWIVLAGTVAGAAWIVHVKQRSSYVALESRQLDGLRISLPKGWKQSIDDSSLINLQDPTGTRTLSVSVNGLDLLSLLGGRRRTQASASMERIPMGDSDGQLLIAMGADDNGSFYVFSAARGISSGGVGRRLTIELRARADEGEPPDPADRELIKRVAATVQTPPAP